MAQSFSTAEPWDGLPRVEAVTTFLEFLPITAGILTGGLMQLLPGQQQFIEDVYGARMIPVRIGVKSEPRGNGKTGLVAGLALCHLLGPEAEERGQIYSASIDRPMASLVFAEMAAIILAVPMFAARVNIQRFHKRIEVLSGKGAGSVYEALSADSRRAHGLRPSLWVYDELAQAKDSELLGNLRTAMGKTHRSLGLVISTQAPEDDHPLSRLIDEGLGGGDPSLVVHLTAAPDDADPFDPEVIRAANPALGHFLDESVLLNEAEQARRVPAWEAKFRNLRLNQRVAASADARLAHAVEWRDCEAGIDLELYAGRPCYGGLDLAIKHDLAACVLVFPEDDQDTRYDVAAMFWTPSAVLAQRPPAEEERLREWIRAGYVEAIAAPIITHAFVARRLAELAQRFDIVGMAYDPWQLANPEAQLELDLPWLKFGQGHTQVMAAAIRSFTECVKSGRLRHGGNPALTASVLGASIIPDTSGNPKLDKSRERFGLSRIDGAVALVMALGTARQHVGEHVDGRLVFA